MSSARIQKLNALLKRVEQRRREPRLLAVPAALAAAPNVPANNVLADEPEQDLFASTIPPAAARTVPPAEPRLPSVRPEPAAAASAKSPLEAAMAQLGVGREDSGPLRVETLAAPRPSLSRPSLPDPQFSTNQDLLLTHRPEAGSSAPPPGPIVELVQPKLHTPREPTLQFDTGVKANPATQRDLKPIGLDSEPPPEAALSAASEKLVPAPLPAHAAPARVVSSARTEVVRTFGELLDASLSLRPGASSTAR